MGALIPFTSNYTDVSTYEGYQFEFRCQRCGNGYRSAFRHSVTGFGGRIASLGGSLLGGEVGARVQEVGLLAQWDRSSTRGSTNDKRLLEASQDVAGCFVQCRGCAEWVCRDVCWADHAGCCEQCMQQRAAYAPPWAQPPVTPPLPPTAQPPMSPMAQPMQAMAQPPMSPIAQPPGMPMSPMAPPMSPMAQPMQAMAPPGMPMPQPPMTPPRVSLRHPHRPTATAYCPSCGSATSGKFCGSCGCPVAPPACYGCGAPARGTAFCTHCGTPAR